jgi:hypothetical protein
LNDTILIEEQPTKQEPPRISANEGIQISLNVEQYEMALPSIRGRKEFDSNKTIVDV